MATYVKVAGTWKTVTTDSPSNGVCGYVKVNGTWRTVNQSYTRINGTWRSVCTAPGQQPAPVQQSICYRPNYCLNGTNGVISPTTEACYLPDGSIGSRTAPYTCQTDPGCTTFTVPAGTCTRPDPIISVTSEEIGDCEFWGGLSGCTNGYGKRVTKKYSDGSLKVSYNCCDPLTGNVKYYCTLRPYATGSCLNELKNEDITGTVIAGQGEWVCEAAGITTFPSCRTNENCTNPKTTASTYESCGYLNTGQRLVTARTFQSWCDVTQDTVIGECLGEIPKCGGAYCGPDSGEEEYPNGQCPSGTAIRYKCLTPEGCDTIYTFKRCTTYTPPTPPNPGVPATPLYQVTEVCLDGPNSSTVASCRQYSTYTPTDPTDAFCYNQVSSNGTFIACPVDTPPDPPPANCPVLSTSQSPCTTDAGGIGSQTIQITPIGCDDIYGPCTAVGGSNPCNTIIDSYSSPCSCPNGTSTGTQTIQVTPGDCPNIEGACRGCPGGDGGGVVPACNGTCTYGSGTQPCGTNGVQSYCITAVGCPDIYGYCNEPTVENPVEPPVVPTDPEAPLWPPDTCLIWCNGEVIGAKSINVNTLVRTKDGLVAAHDLKVGDKLISADVESFPYDNLLTTNMDILTWGAENPYVHLVETEIVNLRTRTSKWAVIVDSDIFSDTHYIMVKREGITTFVKALDLEHTDLIWSYSEQNWLSISVLEKVDVNHEVISIDCEPYDIFFTERMLTHDSNTVD